MVELNLTLKQLMGFIDDKYKSVEINYIEEMEKNALYELYYENIQNELAKFPYMYTVNFEDITKDEFGVPKFIGTGFEELIGQIFNKISKYDVDYLIIAPIMVSILHTTAVSSVFSPAIENKKKFKGQLDKIGIHSYGDKNYDIYNALFANKDEIDKDVTRVFFGNYKKEYKGYIKVKNLGFI